MYCGCIKIDTDDNNNDLVLCYHCGAVVHAGRFCGSCGYEWKVGSTELPVVVGEVDSSKVVIFHNKEIQGCSDQECRCTIFKRITGKYYKCWRCGRVHERRS